MASPFAPTSGFVAPQGNGDWNALAVVILPKLEPTVISTGFGKY
jgi:hypothetical protein